MTQERTNPMPSVTASANAEIKVTPDIAIVRTGAIAQAKTAKDAQNEVNTKMQAFIDRANKLIGSKGRIETGRINLMPVYSQSNRPDQPYVPQIVGYRADNSVTIELSDFTLVGPVIDTAVDAGLNNVEQVTFGLKDDTAARLDALKQAVIKAKQKAGVMAEAAGVQLGTLLDLSEGGAVVMPYQMQAMDMRAGAAVAPTPVLPGMVTVNASVTIRYLIR